MRLKNVVSGNILQSYRYFVHGQGSNGPRSKVTWVKVGLSLVILAGGLMTTSSYIFIKERTEKKMRRLVSHLTWMGEAVKAKKESQGPPPS